MSQSRCIIGIAVATVFSVVGVSRVQADMRAAKKEGEVMWYSSLTNRLAQPVCNIFNKKKLGIKCILHRSGSGKIYRRYMLETKGGIYRADVIHTSNIGHFLIMKQKKIFTPYKPKGVDNFNPAFRTKDNIWTILRAGVYVAAYNTTKIKASEAPKSWADILDPKWKGRLVHSHPRYSGFVTMGMIALVKKFGWDYYKKLAKLKPKILQSAAASTTLVARGEAHLAAGTGSYNVYGAIQKGEPIKMIVPKEGVALVTSPNSLLKKAPHPNAAKVFIDYLFSLETQQYLVTKGGLYVGHPGVTYPKGWPTLKDLKLIIIPPEEVRRKSKPIRKTFRKIFGV